MWLLKNKNRSSQLWRALIGLCCLFCLIATDSTWATTSVIEPVTKPQSQRILDLKQGITLVVNRNKVLTKKHQQLQAELPETVEKSMLWQADLDVTNAELNVHSAEIALQRSSTDMETINLSIRDLEQLLATSNLDPDKLAFDLKEAKNVRSQQQSYHHILKRYRHALLQLLATQKSWQTALNKAWEQKQQRQREHTHKQKIKKLIAERSLWSERLKQRRAQALKEVGGEAVTSGRPQILSDIEMLQAEEKAQLLSQQITVLEIKDLYSRLSLRQEEAKDNVLLVLSLSNNIEHLIDSVKSSQKQTLSKLELLRQYQTTLRKNHESVRISEEQWQADDQLLQGLLAEYQLQSEQQQRLVKELQQLKFSLTEGKQALGYRQPLPKTAQQWQVLATSLAYVPTMVGERLREEWLQAKNGLSESTVWQILALVGAQFLLLLACVWGWRMLRKTMQTKEDNTTSFIARLSRFSADSLARNIVIFSLLWLLGSLGLMLLVTGATLTTILWLVVILLIFKFSINTARIILVENLVDVSGKDVRLFQLIRGTFVIGGILTALLMMTHQLTLPINVAGTIDRLYMVILLLISYPPLRHAAVVNQLLAPYGSGRPYLHKVISISVYLIPAAFFSNAIIGLMGYINLAWYIGVAEGKILMLACLWLAGKGLLDDLLNATSELLIRRVSNGWLLTQAVLVPIHLLLVVLLWVAIISCGFILFGVTIESQLEFLLKHVFATTLFTMGEVAITSRNLLEFVVVLSVVIWASKWSREFSYRWLYNGVKDSGVRDSLSMFTQYALIVIGFFAILAVLGIDLTTITVVAAAFSIGIAFGVRDIVNNVLSGLLLLIERPIRKGDWISVMDFEGEVTHIGLRAVTILTGDNREVIVPNTETMIKPFTNWTRCDSVVREELVIPVAFYDNPESVCDIVTDATSAVAGILQQPKVEALLKDINNGLLQIKLRYHVDMRVCPSRSGVKSKVIKAIWQALTQAGIALPVPQHGVKVR